MAGEMWGWTGPAAVIRVNSNSTFVAILCKL